MNNGIWVGLAVGLAFSLGYALGFKRAVREVRDFILRGRRR